MASINKKAASIAAVSAAAVAIGLGVSSGARADDASPTPSPTSTSSSSGDAKTDANGQSTGKHKGKGWGPGGRHGLGGIGKHLSGLATKLGVDETKLEVAVEAVRDELKAARMADKSTPRPANPDLKALQDEFATKLAAKLGISADKVKTAISQLRAEAEANRVKAFSAHLDQAVKDGKLTQAEADAVKKAAKAGIIGMGGPGKGRGPR